MLRRDFFFLSSSLLLLMRPCEGMKKDGHLRVLRPVVVYPFPSAVMKVCLCFLAVLALGPVLAGSALVISRACL